jgi:hypothetical protein
MRQQDQYPEQRSFAPPRHPSVGSYRFEQSRSDPADEFERMSFRPETPARHAPSSNASSAGVPYEETRSWQTTSNRSSFANMSTRDDTPQSTIQAQKDEMMANFFDAAAGTQGPVHGCMIQVRSLNTDHQSSSEDTVLQSPYSWHGKPTTWNLIRELKLDPTVDIVCFLQNSHLFQSFSDADHVCRNASHIFQKGDLVLDESRIHGWIIEQKSKLQQQLDILYNEEILPVHMEQYFRIALQNAGEILSHWMFDQTTSESDSESLDIHSIAIQLFMSKIKHCKYFCSQILTISGLSR